MASLIDTGSFLPAQHERSFAGVRAYTTDPVHTAICTHGHVDHAYGLPASPGRPNPFPRLSRTANGSTSASVSTSSGWSTPAARPTTTPGSSSRRPYLKPVYDEPDFIVRNVYRCLGGWYSGLPSELKPAPRGRQAREIATLAGGVRRLLARAQECVEDGQLAMACHLVDWAAEPESREVHELRAEVYGRRVSAEPSTMSRGIFATAARDSSERSGTT
jgi:alkyl sulfatase BDS1-like metallo-beta-lactamase superfamily hydrolase